MPPLPTVTACVLAAIVVGLVPATTAPAVAAATPGCAVAPASSIADVPWPQQRYDLDLLGQITDGAGVVVAVVDSGVDGTQPQLAGRVLAGSDLLDPVGDGRLDCVGHGTAVASIIAAVRRPGAGLRGLAPGAKILPVRVSERIEVDGAVIGRGVDAAGLADGIDRAVAGGAGVVNLSISVGVDDPRLRRAVARALTADVVVVAAVGNQHERGDPTPYPAAYPGVVGVGAIGADGNRVATSPVGSYVDIVAPGDGVIGAVPGGGHATFQGSSFAAPFVSATAALIRSHRPQLRQADVVRRLLATADPAGGAGGPAGYGSGVLNPVRAVTELVRPTSAQPPRAEATAAAAPPTIEPRANRPGQVMLVLASGIGLATVVVVGLAVIAPMGRRRRWRAGRTEPG
jgi:type VII secretion-associated serine protease mycosin